MRRVSVDWAALCKEPKNSSLTSWMLLRSQPRTSAWRSCTASKQDRIARARSQSSVFSDSCARLHTMQKIQSSIKSCNNKINQRLQTTNCASSTASKKQKVMGCQSHLNVKSIQQRCACLKQPTEWQGYCGSNGNRCSTI